MFGPSKNAALTEKNLPDQSGKVFIVSGATSGVGKELVQILYAKNARIYMAARSELKATTTITDCKLLHPESTGSLEFLSLNLSDLSSIKSSVQAFLSQESKLDILWNNAGVMVPPQGSVTTQDYELQLGTNALGHFLFTKLLTPLLVETAKTAPVGSVRVVWVASSAARVFAPDGGVDMGNLDYKNDQKAWHKYGVSKAANILYAKEFAKRYVGEGVLSFPLDPGNLKTNLIQHIPGWQASLLGVFVLNPPIYGAYTELFAGFSDSLLDKNGVFIQPYGVVGATRKDIEASAKSKAEGGTGVGEEFWEWSEVQVAPFV